jgi:chromosome segregation ATPase
MKLLNLLIAVFFMLLTFNSIAQNKLEDSHKKLSQQHAALTKKIDGLIAGSEKDVKKAVEEIGVLLEQAKKDYSDVEKKLTPTQKDKTKTEHEAIKKNYDKASTHYKTMQEESIKASPDLNKIKEQGKLINSQIKDAEKQHGTMKKSLGK